MRMSPIKTKIPVKISLSKSRIIETDISNELAIDTSNLREEVLEQPAKFALWSVLSEFAETNVKMATEKLVQSSQDNSLHKQALDNYIAACKHYDLIASTKTALSHRSNTLLQLCNNPTSKHKILVDYKNKLSSIGAFSA